MPIPPGVVKHAFLATAIALVLAPAAASAARPFDTWGKAGVSFEDYRADAESCGRSVYYADISGTDHAQAFVQATRRLQAADDHGMGPTGADSAADMYRMAELGARSEMIRASIRPEKLMRELHVAMVSLVEDCLEERGYSRFRLTADQNKALRKLKRGSPERHRFLHALASDAGVLTSQRLDHG